VDESPVVLSNQTIERFPDYGLFGVSGSCVERRRWQRRPRSLMLLWRCGLDCAGRSLGLPNCSVVHDVLNVERPELAELDYEFDGSCGIDTYHPRSTVIC
jgi:hypothetical protein